jgi:hypothetical protein
MKNVKTNPELPPAKRRDASDVEPLKLLVRWANDEVLAAANMTIRPSDFLVQELARRGPKQLNT